MSNFLAKSFFFLLKLVIVLLINFLLFLVIPLTHELFGTIKHNEKNISTQPRIIAEYIKPPNRDEPKESEKRIRHIQTSRSLNSSQKSMNFKFTPDLGAEGGGDGVAMAAQQLNVMIFEEGEVDEEAQPISRSAIPYPQRARELGIEGDLIMILLIGTDGHVESVEIIKSPDNSISKSAREIILKNWKFKPAKNQGVPVKQRLKQKISFKLNS